MKRKTVALYDPYLDVMGGGERHILSILKVLQEEEFDPIIFWNKDLTNQIQNTLHISFNPPVTFKKNIFNDPQESIFSRMDYVKQFDTLIYVTDGSYFFSTAKRNFIFCMVPQKSLYNMSAINKLKTMNVNFISNSQYTQGWLRKWGVSSEVIYPYISQEFLNNYSQNKEKKILVVGRFFKQLHAKRQDLAISWFNTFQSEGKFKDYKLILAGSLKDEDQDYYHELQQMAHNNNAIEFYPNCSFDELLKLYNKSEIYWHMTGIDVDIKNHPEKVEHLGITPLEAMASGCLVFGYNAGGLQEIIKNDTTGYLFNSQANLLHKMEDILSDSKKKVLVQNAAQNYVKKTFDYSIFKERVKEVML